jgi:Phage major capsid protein E
LDARYRMPGEAIGSKLSSADRVMQLQNDDYLQLDLAISRTEEQMVSDVLFSGKLLIVDGDDGQPINEIDYGPINLTVIDPANYWDIPTGNPLNDLQALKRLVIRYLAKIIITLLVSVVAILVEL